ncbi:uncharacterized protein [Diadema antillarum]|uniref:uncharacterized protein n=1 Tax=Diadema antillarum TaxID=105358 RepID=UPI003A83D637
MAMNAVAENIIMQAIRPAAEDASSTALALAVEPLKRMTRAQSSAAPSKAVISSIESESLKSCSERHSAVATHGSIPPASAVMDKHIQEMGQQHVMERMCSTLQPI